MTDNECFQFFRSFGLPYFKSHPWHGVEIGKDPPTCVTAYIEIVPTDTVKYELDKQSGHLRVDGSQRFSNVCPTLYGLIPQTYCGPAVGEYSAYLLNRPGLTGDQHPLDICVLTEKNISHGGILLEAIPIGGLRKIDGEHVDDKIVAVLKGDAVYEQWHDIKECPVEFVERLMHYFLKSKEAPGPEKNSCEITHVYGREEAHEVIRLSQRDYTGYVSQLQTQLNTLGTTLN